MSAPSNRKCSSAPGAGGALQEAGRVNLNDFEWDQHLSFSAATLDLSPDGSFLLVSTDGPRILVLRIRGGHRRRCAPPPPPGGTAPGGQFLAD